MFWLLSTLIFLVTAAIAVFPMLRGRNAWQPVALAIAGLVPIIGFYLYDQVGQPEAMQMARLHPPAATGADDMDQMVEQLQTRLAENPEDAEGWLLLIRTLKTTQRHADALEATETAHRALPDHPGLMVELVEARIFNSGDGRIGDEDIAMLKRALDIDDDQQKALWLLGIAAAQSGDFEGAIDWWEKLLQELEPGGTVANSVQQQINQARAQLGLPPVQPDAPSAGPSLPISIRLAPAAVGSIPPGGVLFLIARPSGETAGPPLAVKRINGPRFPIETSLSDANSMLAERPLSSVPVITLQARFSATGSPVAQPGDWRSDITEVYLDQAPHVEIVIGERLE